MSEQQIHPNQEVYGESLSRFRSYGEVAVLGALAVQEAERQLLELWADFTTQVGEMLLSNPEVRENFEITNWSEFMGRDDKLFAKDGKTDVEDMVANGYHKSVEMAKHDPRFETQANYDAAHLFNAREVAAMVRGERGYNTRIVPAVYPEDAVKRDGAQFWRRGGYDTEAKTSFIQMFYAPGDGSIKTGTLSVDDSNKHIWRELFAAHGTEIPENAPTEDYLCYAITLTLTEEEARQFALDLRQQYYKRATGEVRPRKPIESLLNEREAELQQTFNQLWIPLALSVTSGRWQPALRSFVNELLARSQSFTPEIRQNLMYMSTTDKMTDADARAMQRMICYAQVESLRATIVGQKSDGAPQATTFVLPETKYAPIVADQQFLAMLAGAAQEGAASGRAYITCGNAIEMGMQNADTPADDGGSAAEANPLGVFGGSGEHKKMSCPFCGDQNQIGDPCSPNQFCTSCAAMVIGGKVVSEGNGGKPKPSPEQPAPSKLTLLTLLQNAPSPGEPAKTA